ncbi:polyhydroxyalkanoate synthesis regulator DNA-binding domain-containing protein [Streptomyces sp. NBUL23]|uniref:polyhydroxyalkanoate synthesis regulator DNA-binding domain-containing protein n=1 Tax=Streptomyces sp. NBUL23 TaxID=3381354 RepID=UPI003871D215
MTTPTNPGTDEERLLVRTDSARLSDARTRQIVTLDELAADVRAGRRFRVTEDRCGGECTYQVLAQVLLAALAPAAPRAIQAGGTPEPRVDAVLFPYPTVAALGAPAVPAAPPTLYDGESRRP